MTAEGTAVRDGLARRALELIDADEIRDLTVALIREGSENPPAHGATEVEAGVVRVLADACERHGLDVRIAEVAPGRPNLTARLGDPDAPGLLLLVHTDTVPAGAGWTVPPLGGTVADGRVVGRGAADMKGGIAAAVAAMSALRRAAAEAGVAPPPVTLAAVADEEETGTGARAFTATHPETPSANPGSRGTPAAPHPRNDSSTHAGHDSGAYARHSRGAHAGDGGGRYAGAIVAEPTEMRTIVACRGDCYVEVEVCGRAAHAGDPDTGANAVYGAARVIEAVRALHEDARARPHPLLGPRTWNVGLVTGGSGTAVVPDRCRVSADRRLLPGETGADAVAEIDDVLAMLRLDDMGLSARAWLGMEMPGFETPEDHPLVRAAHAAAREAGGPDLPVAGWTAACDGGFLSRDLGLPVVVLGPGSVVHQAHRPDESVSLTDLHTAARAYVLSALRLRAA